MCLKLPNHQAVRLGEFLLDGDDACEDGLLAPVFQNYYCYYCDWMDGGAVHPRKFLPSGYCEILAFRESAVWVVPHPSVRVDPTRLDTRGLRGDRHPQFAYFALQPPSPLHASEYFQMQKRWQSRSTEIDRIAKSDRVAILEIKE
jgi:hypothetical protein